MRTCVQIATVCAVIAWTATAPRAWGGQGHRLVAMLASTYLTSTARQNVAWLLGNSSLADVSVWADQYLDGNVQTAVWHYVNIPALATTYDRNRDCPAQPGVAAGGRGDTWRDCVIDRILYNQERLANPSLDRADRAVALKFLVHLVGDVHQPFHAIGVERGGNGIPVIAFGQTDCSMDGVTPRPCNLHGIWDGGLIAHRRLGDLQYLTTLQQSIRHHRLDREPIGTPVEWALQSHALARAALMQPYAKVDEAYYSEQIRVVDERLALAGLRLAALINRSLSTPPPR